jgi:tRNA-Thr(GGU) m(6)t(6)A37 methyltransferase TsaA
VTYEAIGIIHTPFTEKANTPVQGVFTPDSKGEVEVFPRYVLGLRNIEGFSHLILIYHFHLAEGCSLIAKPFLDREEKGIFSIRHFNRPNPIGLSIVQLHKVKGNILEVSEIDILDGTPLLDIKPYIPEFDARHNARRGWYEYASERGELRDKSKGV